MKGYIKKLLREGLVNENDSRGVVEFLKTKYVDKTFLYHGTSISQDRFTLKDDY